MTERDEQLLGACYGFFKRLFLVAEEDGIDTRNIFTTSYEEFGKTKDEAEPVEAQ